MAHLELQHGTFAAADTLLGGRDSRVIGHNTRLIRLQPDTIGVQYHSTVVYTMTRDGWAIIRTGGWRTVTTVARISALLPGPWGVSFTRGLYRGGRLVTPYTDGLAVHLKSGAVGYAPTGYHPDVLLTSAEVDAIVAAADAAAEVRAAKRAERIARQHPAPRHLYIGLGNVGCDRPDCNGEHFIGGWPGGLARLVDLSHGVRRQWDPQGPHGGRSQWRKGRADGCEPCRIEAAEAKAVRAEALAAEHDTGYTGPIYTPADGRAGSESYPAHVVTAAYGWGRSGEWECPKCEDVRRTLR